MSERMYSDSIIYSSEIDVVLSESMDNMGWAGFYFTIKDIIKSRAVDDGSTIDADYYSILCKVLSCEPRTEMDIPIRELIAEPFAPQVVINGNRSFLPPDLTDDECVQLVAFVEISQSEILVAIASDMLWLRRYGNGIQHAKRAISLYCGLYLGVCRRRVGAVMLARRCLHLYIQTKANPDCSDGIDGFIAEMLSDAKYNAIKSPIRSIQGIKSILQSFKSLDSRSLMAEICDLIVASHSDDDYIADECYELKYRLEASAERRATIAKSAFMHFATCSINAMNDNQPPDAIRLADVAAGYVKRLPKAILSSTDLSCLFDQMMSVRNSAKTAIVNDMKSVCMSVDLKPLIEQRLQYVSNVSADQAVKNLAIISEIPSADELRWAQEQSTSTLMGWISPTYFNLANETRELPSSQNAVDNKSDRLVFCQHVKMRIDIAIDLTATIVRAAMDVIHREHHVNRDYWKGVCKYSWLVPSSNEDVISAALHAGFNYQFSHAFPVLVTQLEGLIRYAIEQSGVSTTNITERGKEESVSIQALLMSDGAKKIFGEDLIVLIRGLFYDELGLGLRHIIAHGKATDTVCGSNYALYSWWFIMRLVVLLSPLANLDHCLDTKVE